MEILGITIPTVIHDIDAVRCEGCNEPIDGQPMRVSILDIVATEAPPSWATRSPINPGPHQFHADEAHIRAWMRRSGYLWCRKSPGATGAPPAAATRTPMPPGPHQFHADEARIRAWMRRSGYLWCRKSAAREIMRPIPIPADAGTWGLCDGFHRDDHELVPA
jgi:hypothetical protein